MFVVRWDAMHCPAKGCRLPVGHYRLSPVPWYFMIDRCSNILLFRSGYPYRNFAFDTVKIMRCSNQQYPWRPQSFISVLMNTIVKYLCKNVARYLPSFTEVRLLGFFRKIDFYVTVQFNV